MTLQVSFEFFPPRTPEMEETLWRAIKRLEPLSPRFISVTYGAGGSTRERTHRTVKRILAETALQPAAHAFLQSREDLSQAVAGLSTSQLWMRPGGAASIGFHLRHIAGAIDRLTALEGVCMVRAL